MKNVIYVESWTFLWKEFGSLKLAIIALSSQIKVVKFPRRLVI